MKLRLIAGLLLICFVGIGPVAAGPYEKMWKQVKEFERKDLPRSAYEVVKKISKKAEVERRQGQQVAALLYGCMLRQTLVPDSFYSDMRMLERRKRETTDEVLRAVYASVLGELYAGRASMIARRTEGLPDVHPDSIQEWSHAQYMEAARANFRLSLEQPGVLIQAKAVDFLPFVKQGKDAVYFQGDLLNVIGRRAIEGVYPSWEKQADMRNQVAEWYTLLCVKYRERHNREAELLWRLDSVERMTEDRQWPYPVYRKNSSAEWEKEVEEEVLKGEKYKAYHALREEFSDLNLVAEVYLAMLDLNVNVQLKKQWAEEALQRYPEYPRIAEFRNRLAGWSSSYWQAEFPEVVYPGSSVKVPVEHRNLPGGQLVWYRVEDGFPLDSVEWLRHDRGYRARHSKRVRADRMSWEVKDKFVVQKDTMAFNAPETGLYLVTFYPDKRNGKETDEYSVIRVSRMNMWIWKIPGSEYLCKVVDAQTGKPIPGAEVNLLSRMSDGEAVKENIVTDDSGSAETTRMAHVSFVQAQVTKAEDRYLPTCRSWGYSSVASSSSMKEVTALYTDRSIYRPGQTVYVGGIMYMPDESGKVVPAGRKTKVELYDVNGKRIAENQVETDRMGTWETSFVLPVSGLNGGYSVRNGNQRAWFQVETYKRPVFEVKMQPVDCLYQLGDTITLRGEARTFTGVPVRNARVTGDKQVVFPYFGRWDQEQKYELDTVYTDREGHFSIRVPLEDLRVPGYVEPRLYVNLYVMNGAGETHDVHESISLSKRELYWNVQAPEMWCKEREPFFEAGMSVRSRGDIKDSVQAEYSLYRVSVSGEKELIYKGVPFEVRRKVKVKDMSIQPEGKYELHFWGKVKGDTASYVHPFVWFSETSVRPVTDTIAWFYCSGDTLSKKRDVRIQVGSSAKDVTLYYALFAQERLLKDTLIVFSDSILNFDYRFDEAYGEGVEAHYVFVKEGNMNRFRKMLRNKYTDRELRMEWTSFRDRLKPGTKEEWKLKVRMPDGKPAPAQLMAVLYDASLDRLNPHCWGLPMRFIPDFLPHVSFARPSFSYAHLNYREGIEWIPVEQLMYDCFDQRLMDRLRTNSYGNILLGRQDAVPMLAMSAGLKGRIAGLDLANKTRSEKSVEVQEEAVSEDEAAIAGEGRTDDREMAESESLLKGQVRENLNETAFFYPRLQTDGNGDVAISFTLPESLTTWNFMALAHTADMMTGLFRDEVTAVKEVMAQLNLPRFVRLGDQTVLSASLYNLCDRKLKGKVTMEVFDPKTEKVLWREVRKLKMQASADTVLNFVYVPVEGYSLLACRVWLDGGRYTDGEQRYLPVLENKEWVTETLPFRIKEKGTHTFDLASLFGKNHPEAEGRRLTVEYTGNPLWYAVQALPSVLTPREGDVGCLAGAYYASVVTRQLIQRYPKLQKTVEQWNLDTPEGLESALKQQEELTGILVDETPWLTEAENETQRMRSLQQLFDENRQQDVQRGLAERLGRLQCADGAFGWFNGMRGNQYMTLKVATYLARAGVLRDKTEQEFIKQHVKLDKMMNYLAGCYHQAVKKHKQQKTADKTDGFGVAWLSYLYLAGLSGDAWFDASARADLKYGLEQLKKEMYQLSLPDKARAAVVWQQTGMTREADEMIRSLREHLVTSGKGIALEYSSESRYPSERKIATHVAIMEALADKHDEETMEGLCQWLLEQKRVQAWATVETSAKAVYALLKCQGDLLDVDSRDTVEVTLPSGKEICQLVSGESGPAGLNMVKTQVEGKELQQGVSTLKVQKNASDPVSWGAVYAQYRLPLKEVKALSSGLRVRNEVSDVTPKVGDRVMLRYVVTSDRDYEYVRLKVGHAACLEPVDARSGYERQSGVGFYKDVRDASTSFFFEHLPKGTYIFEVEMYVEREGIYTLGLAELTEVYAPEFAAHSEAVVLEVKP